MTSTIKSNKGYATEQLINLKGTLNAGGLYRIGDIHVLNARITTNQALSKGDTLANLPFNTPALASVQIYGGLYKFDSFSNVIRCSQSIPKDELLVISGVFVV